MKNLFKISYLLSLLFSFSIFISNISAIECVGEECATISSSSEDVDKKRMKLKVGEKVSDWVIQNFLNNDIGALLGISIPKSYAQSDLYTTTTTLGFENSTASGLELNNPVPVQVIYTDTDGANDMEALYFWMGEKGVLPSKSPRFVDELGWGNNAKTESNSQFGFMLRRVGDDWSNVEVYIPEIVNAGNYWVQRGEWGDTFFIDGPNGLPMVKITRGSLSVPSSNRVDLNFDIEFLHENSGVAEYESVKETEYDILGMVHDEFSFVPWDNYDFDENVDLTVIRNYFSENEIREYDQWQNMGLNWLIDLTPPTVTTVVVEVTGDNELGIRWAVEDDESGLGYVVGNVYRSELSGSITDTLLYVGPNPEKEYEIPEFDEDTIGSLLETKLWMMNLLSVSQYSRDRTEYVDIQENTGGFLDFYVTVYDKAGNYDILSDSFSLSSWMITKGGLVYSTEGTSIAVRLLNLEPEQDWSTDLWYNPDSQLDTPVFDSNLSDLSTELLSGNVQYPEDLYDLPHAYLIDGIKNLSVKAAQNIGSLRNSLYSRYQSKVNEQATSINADVINPINDQIFTGNSSDISGCNNEYCVVDSEYNITIEPDFVCDTKTVFLSDTNITVKPNLTNANNSSACIFLSGGNINIEEGNYASEGSTEPLYDVLEGYFVADGSILIESGDAGKSVKDGLQVNGGIVGLGGVRSVSILRDMKLIDKAKYPTVAIHGDVRYGKMALEFFGPERSVYKQEIGFKPF